MTILPLILSVLAQSEPGHWERATAWQYRDRSGNVTAYAIDADWLSPAVEPSTAHTATLLGWGLLARRKPFFGVIVAYAELGRSLMERAFPMGPPEPEGERDGAIEAEGGG